MENKIQDLKKRKKHLLRQVFFSQRLKTDIIQLFKNGFLIIPKKNTDIFFQNFL